MLSLWWNASSSPHCTPHPILFSMKHHFFRAAFSHPQVRSEKEGGSKLVFIISFLQHILGLFAFILSSFQRYKV